MMDRHAGISWAPTEVGLLSRGLELRGALWDRVAVLGHTAIDQRQLFPALRVAGRNRLRCDHTVAAVVTLHCW